MPNTDGGAEEPVSFTDTNAETGASGGAGNSSNMADLIGNLDNKESGRSSGNSKASKGGKKKGKMKKSKTKKLRKHDRYEPQNFLFRIEGSIFCGFLWTLLIWIAVNLIVLIAVILKSTANDDDVHPGRGQQDTFCCVERSQSAP